MSPLPDWPGIQFCQVDSIFFLFLKHCTLQIPLLGTIMMNFKKLPSIGIFGGHWLGVCVCGCVCVKFVMNSVTQSSQQVEILYPSLTWPLCCVVLVGIRADQFGSPSQSWKWFSYKIQCTILVGNIDFGQSLLMATLPKHWILTSGNVANKIIINTILPMGLL